ncbi:hypothetical protein FQN54_002353 [Arachnomyces sp. PD_36]|nr:hypothetical protein FQN54_002353 [Arachnomyces sp. PD_36]
MKKMKGRFLKPFHYFRERKSRSPSPQPRSSPATPTPVTAVASSPPVSTKSPQNAALELAIQKHIDKLPEAEKVAFQEASKALTDATLLSRAKEYDNRYRDRSAFRPQAEKISKSLGTLEQFMAGITIVSQSHPEIASLAVGGVRLVIDFAIRFVTFFIKLTDAICNFTDYLEPLGKYATSKDPIIVNAVAAAYGDLLDFCGEVRSVFMDGGEERRWTSVRTFIRVQWEPFEAKFGVIGSNFQHHLDVVHHSASASQLEETRKENLEARLERRRVQMKDKVHEKEQFLQWLAAPDFEKRHLEIYAKKHPQTSTWILDREEFQTWLNGSGQSLLWIYGKPGVGKSVLAFLVGGSMRFSGLTNVPLNSQDDRSNIIEYVSKHYALDESVGFSYVYYDYKDERLRDHSLVMAGIIKQLYLHKKEIPDWLLKHKRSCHSPTTVCNTESFCKMGQDFGKIIIVIDALDECPEEERDKTIGFILDNAKKLGIKFLITSRRESDILEAFKGSKTPKFEIQASNVMGDIETFVRDEVNTLVRGRNGKKLHLKDPSLKNTIVQALAAQSEGMFLWTKLQLESLCRVSKRRQDTLVRDALQTLPQGLEATYIRILRQIKDQEHCMKELALRAFMWVFHAKRPLSIFELENALAVNDSTTSQWERSQVQDRSDVIMDACANLIIIEDDIFRPVHYSAQEFILSDNFQNPESLFLADIRNVPLVNEKLALSCLFDLQLIIIRVGKDSDPTELMIFASRCPFTHYAANYFDLHLYEAKTIPEPASRIVKTILQGHNYISTILLMRRIRNIRSLAEAYSGDNAKISEPNAVDLLYSTQLHMIPELCEGFGSGVPPNLHQVAIGGHHYLAAQMVQDGCLVDGRDDSGATPIFHACDGGHLSIVSLLLDHGADPNIQTGYLGNSLQAASFRGHEKIVKLLLDKGADVNAQGGEYGTALLAASSRGEKGIVKLLLDKETDVNIQNKKYGNALLEASLRGEKSIVKLLLDKEADVNAQGGEYGTALLAASSRGEKGIVKLLLDKEADVNIQNKKYGNALLEASLRGFKEIVQLLLEKGADLNIGHGEYADALQGASFEGHKEIARLLLDKGANVNAHGGAYGNALQAASFQGHKEIVQLLLDKGANVNAQGGKYGNPLQAASASYQVHDYEAIVILLLDKGAHVNAQGGVYGNALQAASFQSHKEIVQLLLDKGANVNAQGGKYGNPLQAASASYQVHDYEAIVILLLDKGADVNAQGGVYGNALQAASEHGCEEIVQLLLDKGANVNAQGGEMGNALQAASFSSENRGVVRLLLDRGADVNARGGYFGCALQASVSSYEPGEVAKLLLDKGADVNMQGGKYGNALQAVSVSSHEGPLKLLLDRGADINAQGGVYGSALQAASFSGRENICRMLIDKGADVDARGGEYGNVLAAAATRSDLEGIVKLMIEKGADVNAPGRKYGNALQAASLKGHDRIVKLLIEKGADVNAPADDECEFENALQAASARGSVKVVKQLLDAGADINAQSGKKYENALHAASADYKPDIVKLLLDRGAVYPPTAPEGGYPITFDPHAAFRQGPQP